MGSNFQGLLCKTPFNRRAVCGALCEAGSSRESQGHRFRRRWEFGLLTTSHALCREPKPTPGKVYGVSWAPLNTEVLQGLLSQDGGYETVALRSQGGDVTRGCGRLRSAAHRLLSHTSYQGEHKMDVSQPVKLRKKLSNLEGNL